MPTSDEKTAQRERVPADVYNEASVKEAVRNFHAALQFLESASRYGYKSQLTIKLANDELAAIDLGRLSDSNPKISVYSRIVG